MNTRRAMVFGCLCLVAASCGGNKGSGGAGASSTTGSSAHGSTSTATNTTSVGTSTSGAGGSSTGTTMATTSTATSTTSTSGTSGTASSSGGTGGAASCLGSDLVAWAGTKHVLVGAAMADATAMSTPFDGRYQYISGGIFDGNTPCKSCATGCTADGTTCANSGPGCAWWGCWQYDQQPPGQFVIGFDGTATTNKEIPMISYYQVLQASGVQEGAAEVTEMNDAAFLTRYLADFRFLAQTIGTAKAIVHIEPDFWGYAEQANADPHSEPAAVQAAAPTDCGTQENSIAGLGRCMIAIVHKYAPNARVGLHASAWGTNMDVLGNTDPTFDVAGEAAKLGNWLLAAGAGDGDLIIADMSDRDAGYYQSIGRNTWWDATNATLPNFTQAFAWAKAVAETTGKPLVWWQIPVGNENLPNTNNAWKDNRVDYLLGHMDQVAASHGAGLFFGAGDGQQTTPESDGGNLIAKVKSYEAAGGQALCP